jgi:hypothetical protein
MKDEADAFLFITTLLLVIGNENVESKSPHGLPGSFINFRVLGVGYAP